MARKLRNMTAERARFGYSQEQLAERMGVSRQTILRWENGKTQPPASAVYMMADLFGCSSDYLLEAKGEACPR